MAKKVKIREIPSKIKEIKSLDESDLEEEIEREETIQFEEFMFSDSLPSPIFNNREEPVEQIIEREPEIQRKPNQTEEIQPRELYDIGRGLGKIDRRSYGPSASMESPAREMREKQIGKDFSLQQQGSQLPENQLKEEELKTDEEKREEKYSIEATKKKRYAWER